MLGLAKNRIGGFKVVPSEVQERWEKTTNVGVTGELFFLICINFIIIISFNFTPARFKKHLLYICLIIK